MSNIRRTGTYIAFHAEGKRNPAESDIRFFNMLKAWNVRSDNDLSFTDSHEKTGAIQDRSKRATVEKHLKSRLLRSKHMVLILTENTKKDTDFVPMEIRYAIDNCKIPIIAAYPKYERISAPRELSHLWPSSLSERIGNGTASVIHVPFKQVVITDAISQFGPSKLPVGGSLGVYSNQAYQQWGLL